jgi:hypothetical protein
MQVVFFVDLSLQLPVHGQPQQVRILLARCQGRVEFSMAQDILQVVDGPTRVLHLLFHRILEIAREVFDLFYFLVEVTPETRESQNHVLLNLPGFVGLDKGLFVVVAQDLQGIVEATRRKKAWRRRRVVQDIGELEKRLGPVFIVRLNLSKVSNEVLQDFAPRFHKASQQQALGHENDSLPWNLLARASVGLPEVGTGQ